MGRLICEKHGLRGPLSCCLHVEEAVYYKKIKCEMMVKPSEYRWVLLACPECTSKLPEGILTLRNMTIETAGCCPSCAHDWYLSYGTNVATKEFLVRNELEILKWRSEEE